MQKGTSLNPENARWTDPDYARFHLRKNRFSSKDKQRIVKRLHSQQSTSVIGSHIKDDPAFWPLNRINIEPVNMCNYRCPLCRTNLKDWVPRRKIELETVKKIISSLAPGLRVVNLYGNRGEPLLHPRLEEIIAYIKSATTAKIRISTNGSLVTDPRAQGLLDAGLDQIVFAVDGLTQRSYSAYRQGGRLEQVVENLRRFCELKAKGDYGTRVIFQFIPMAKNEHELPDVPAFAYALGVDLVFTPDTALLYPDGEHASSFVEVPVLSHIIEGEFRPHFFRGVATVVSKLFNIVQPDIAVFGEKDFQQLLVVKQMVKDLCLPVSVIGGETRREDDGLAMSSRNTYLARGERETSSLLSQALMIARDQIVRAGVDVSKAEKSCSDSLVKHGFSVDYVTVRETSALAEISGEDIYNNKELIILAAVRLGKTRLIDNIIFSLD